MKSTKILLASAALTFCFNAFSQTDTTKKDTTGHKMDTTIKKRPGLNDGAGNDLQHQQSVATQQATGNTSDTAAALKMSTTLNTSNSATKSAGSGSTTYSAGGNGSLSSTPKPNFGRYFIPVLGSYNAVAATTENKSITITGDESNPGKIWIDGLAGTRFYALLKTLPGTYKIPSQKEENGAVAEGTLMYDQNSKQINICIGCGYNDQTPAVTNEVASATSEPVKNSKNHHQQIEKVKKVTVISFSGSKTDLGTVSILQ